MTIDVFFIAGYLAGGIFVNSAAREFMRSIIGSRNITAGAQFYYTGRLEGSAWGDPQFIDLALNSFE